jgi:hypothetical protein
MRRQECVVQVVGISSSVADDTVAVVVLAVEVWKVPKPASWNVSRHNPSVWHDDGPVAHKGLHRCVGPL